MEASRLNLQQLRYVAEVERVGSISRAAKNLYMGQPNLSKAIKELESEIRVTIFKRTARGVEPTPMGEQFLTLQFETWLNLLNRPSKKVQYQQMNSIISCFIKLIFEF